jgi:hypothetical protein
VARIEHRYDAARQAERRTFTSDLEPVARFLADGR